MAIEPPEPVPNERRNELRTPDAVERYWVERAQQGDPEAFRWLLRQHRGGVMRLAANVLQRPEDAEDVAQEAFVKAFRSIGNYRGESRFAAWLYRIAFHVCMDRRRRRVEAELSRADPETDDPAQTHAESALFVRSLLDRLPPQSRAALVLREIEGMEYEEIACVLQIPEGTVRSRLHKARERFRQLWMEAKNETERV